MTTIEQSAAPAFRDPWEAIAPRPLSPSSAADFKQCPRMFRHKNLDRLPDPSTLEQARGTLVHAVLEWLYQQPVGERTVAAAVARAPHEWQTLFVNGDSRDDYPKWFPQWGVTHEEIVEQAQDLLGVYFQMEDPTVMGHPTVEQRITEDVLGVPLRGIIDRIDTAPDGQIRVVDYKTGKAPMPQYEHEALWKMKFYALMWRSRTGTTPARLRLIYLGGKTPRIIECSPTAQELDQFADELAGLWQQVNISFDTLNYPAKTSALCPWCPFQSVCVEGSKIEPRVRRSSR